MHKTVQRAVRARAKEARRFDWRRRISDHVAYALLVYTGLQIFVTMTALTEGHGSILPYFALIVLVAAIIPGCRLFEKRWETIGDRAASDTELAGLFRRDVTVLWLCAIGLPLVLTGLFSFIISLFG
ncbi:hypothetical protein FHS61_002930 [Altererythrobacter atlanticus]|uniref:Uncharacterized protein n=1 Tax=Croceibacterium atlanticum TaxID=1267766 RepID=A0A0F7KWN5_9SPHN|nr:hypothetical protein [Croceibacterium atlanticum]AKH43632.1 hypothetical protein WYH_02602 [Croceibacterium atlanticum]MBB5733884.1 hypothetical protein [Croceibacterium atlanticum]